MWAIHLTLIFCCSLQVLAVVKNKGEHSTDDTYVEGETNPCEGYNQDQEKICQIILRLTEGGDSSLGAQLQQAVDNETIKCAQNLKRQREQFEVQSKLLSNALAATNLSLQSSVRREQELVGEVDLAKQQTEILQGKLDELQDKTIEDTDEAKNSTKIIVEELTVAKKKIEQLNNQVDELKREKSLLKFHFKRVTANENELKLSLTQQEQEMAKQRETMETLTSDLVQAQKALETEQEKSLQQHNTITKLVEHLETKLAFCETSIIKSNSTNLEQERKLSSELEISKQESQNLQSILDDIISELNETSIKISACNESHHDCITSEGKLVAKHQEATKQLQVCEELRRVTTLPPTTATPATTCRYIICKTPNCLNANATKAAALRAVPSSPRNPGSLNLITLNGRKYYLEMRNKRTWFDALAFCKSYGMQLATLESEMEHNTIYAHLISLNVITRMYVYTSMNRVGSRCNYVWENGAPLTYTNWRPGDPWHQATEECMVLTANSWADVPCEQKHAFLCEQVP